MSVELKVPEVGESVTEATINKWLKQEGDRVEKDEIVAELETEKANFELPAPSAGTLSKISKQEGEEVRIGEVIGEIAEGEGGGKSAEEKKSGEAESGQKREAEAKQEAEAESGPERETESRRRSATQEREAREEGAEAAEGDGGRRVMPAARRVLEEHGLDADEVEATGPGGRLLKEDVLRHLERQKQVAPARPAPRRTRVTTGEGREEETVAMSPMRKTIARRLVEVQQTAALLTTFNEIDMSAVSELRKTYREAFEKQHGVRLGFMSFFIKATIDALKRYPALNAEIREDRIVYKNYFDIGVAVSTEKGLVVPVIRDADRLSFAEIEKQINDYAQRARDGRIELSDLEGGTFTITNGGVFGSMMSTPIVNPPQSGVLGMHAITERPVAVDGQVVVRPMMYVALTYDHRLVDGREAVSCLKRIRDVIEAPGRMMIEA
jgi:2-oxoglutarate dehydrogenase E2 component (dihydrolipoamide succinyltransferase)